MSKILDNLRFVGRPPVITHADIYRDVADDIAALPAPEPMPASVQLRRNLERASASYTNRETVLLQEIEARQSELADVRRARDATSLALMELIADDGLDEKIAAEMQVENCGWGRALDVPATGEEAEIHG